MPQPFPHDFIWGFSTSSYQIEGAVHEDGRGESIWDRFTHTPGKIKDGSNGDVACDHYHRWRDDIALMKRLGANAYCFSIAWPRIFPRGTGRMNQAGLDFCSRLVDGLLEAGITPFAKLNHWDLPQFLQDQGGWANRATVDAFTTYAETTLRHLGDRVTHWATHVEPWVITFLGYHQGVFAPGERSFKAALQAAHHLLLAHGRTIPIIRQAVGRAAQVSISLNLTPAYPASEREEDQDAARRFDGYFNRWFLDPLAGRGYPADLWAYYGPFVPDVQPGDQEAIAAPLDFLGVNYYNPARIAHHPTGDQPHTVCVPDPSLAQTADREIRPESLYDLLLRLHREYPFPALVITENGSAWHDRLEGGGRVRDQGRLDFLQSHLVQAARALHDGAPLKGYFAWSLMDNFEWASGYTLRYGIVYTDYSTQTRVLKDSAHWFQSFLTGQAALPL